MPDDVIARIGELIGRGNRFVVAGHQRPDGDAIGSSVALGECLRAAGKEVTVLNEDPVPENLVFLPRADAVRRPAEFAGPVEADAFFIVDTANRERAGTRVLESVAAPVVVNIDHHASNPGYGDLVLLDPGAAATGQIVYRLVEELGLPLPAAARDHLFAAISTDSGSFRYPSTTAETFRVAMALAEAGADAGAISQQLYETYPFRRVELLRYLLNRMRLQSGGRLASWSLPRATVEGFGLAPSDSEGLIDTIRAIDSVVLAVFFEELGDGRIRVSSRSKSPRVDVGKLCAAFGGGGHPLAAGARLPGPLAAAEDRFLAAAEQVVATAFPPQDQDQQDPDATEQ